MLFRSCINTTAEISNKGEFIGNPSECAMLMFYEESRKKDITKRSYKEEREEHPVLQCFPFNSDIKHMTTVCMIFDKTIAFTKGSPETILGMCSLSDEMTLDIERHMIEAEKKAMRIIAFAHKELPEVKDYSIIENHAELEQMMVFDGFVAIADPLRSEVYEAIKNCGSAGVEVKILTGDNIITATAIASQQIGRAHV